VLLGYEQNEFGGAIHQKDAFFDTFEVKTGSLWVEEYAIGIRLAAVNCLIRHLKQVWREEPNNFLR
jgi:hypothetical protein